MLTVKPMSLADANRFVAEYHRHHKPVRGHKFSLGCMANGRLAGVAIVGRPVSRYLDDGLTLEVKTILPVASAALLYYIFRSACVKNGELDYLWLWILCGLPFGIWRLRLWIIPGGGSLGTGIALFALNFILAGFIGGFVLAWRLLVAAWYVPLTLYRLLTAGCACIITED